LYSFTAKTDLQSVLRTSYRSAKASSWNAVRSTENSLPTLFGWNASADGPDYW